MSQELPGGVAPQPVDPQAKGSTIASRLGQQLASGGPIAPLITVLVAFLAGGLVVAVTGHDPVSTYRAIFEGTGLQWFFPWTSDVDREIASTNLQQTLINTAPLILTGLAVAFAFRSGLFNIGGQGQYIVGSIAAVYVGSQVDGLPAVLHVVLAIVAACLAGALYAGIAGLLRATTGANEVITTIMLNWIAIYSSFYLFGIGGPLQNGREATLPVSDDVLPSAKLPVFWGDPDLQGLHIGIFVSLAAAIVFWVVLNRSKIGYEARAVGFNPEAARYGGIKVGRTYFLVMALCGLFAGLAGAIDILGWQFRLATNDVQISSIGFLGIAVALLGRNTAFGTVMAALLFGALLQGTSVRNLDPAVFEPQLAQNLTLIIQGLVVLLVTLDVFLLAMWQRMRTRRGKAATEVAVESRPAGGGS